MISRSILTLPASFTLRDINGLKLLSEQELSPRRNNLKPSADQPQLYSNGEVFSLLQVHLAVSPFAEFAQHGASIPNEIFVDPAAVK